MLLYIYREKNGLRDLIEGPEYSNPPKISLETSPFIYLSFCGTELWRCGGVTRRMALFISDL